MGTLFGTSLGAKVREWCARWGWPLVWSPGVYAHPEPSEWPPTNFSGRRRAVDPGSLVFSRAGHNVSTAVIDAGEALFKRWWDAANTSRSAAGSGDPTTETVSMWWDALTRGDGAPLKIESLYPGDCTGGSSCIGVFTNDKRDCLCYPV